VQAGGELACLLHHPCCWALLRSRRSARARSGRRSRPHAQMASALGEGRPDA
jgi:hypothetical protein